MKKLITILPWAAVLGAVLIITCTSTRPSVHIIVPNNNEIVSGTVDIEARITGEHIARVEFFIDGMFQATAMHPPFSIVWPTHTLVDSSYHIIIAKAYDRVDHVSVSVPIRVLVDNTIGKPRNTLHLVSGRINNTVLSISDPAITVRSGADIAGDLVVRANNQGDPDWGAPVGGTPTWGDHITNYWETGIWLPGGISEHTTDLFLQAPDGTGLYYIFVAWGHETDCSHVMALSFWQYEGSPEWNDGNDVADWIDEQAHMAIDSGFVRSTYRYDDSGYGIKYVPAIAIRVHVIK